MQNKTSKEEIAHAEAELSITPLEGLRLDVNYTYLNATIRQISRPTCPLSRMFCRPNTSLFRVRSGMSSVRSSSTATNPGSSPATVIVPQPRYEPLKASLIRTQSPI